jgi:hypothetical protein
MLALMLFSAAVVLQKKPQNTIKLCSNCHKSCYIV